jgi:hypothetical protein
MTEEFQTPPRRASTIEEQKEDDAISPLRCFISPRRMMAIQPRLPMMRLSQEEICSGKKNPREVAQEWAVRLQQAIPVLLDKLETHMTISEEDVGMTLPASAIGWISQDYLTNPISSMYRDRVRSLKVILSRVTHLRVTRQLWPPELRTSKHSHQQSTSPTTSTSTRQQQQRRRRRPLETLQMPSASSSSVCSALTTEDPISQSSFLESMALLEKHPSLDLTIVFPSLQFLVLESVPITWIANFADVIPKLTILRIHKACLYNHCPALLAKESNTLTHLRFNHCKLDELSKLPKLYRKVPKLKHLNLAHNEIHRESTALKGLVGCKFLQTLNLSWNQLQALPRAHWVLGKTLKILDLTGNRLQTLEGIDKLDGLEELYLDQNQLSNVILLQCLTKLPLLKKLSFLKNSFLYKPPPTQSKTKKIAYEQVYCQLIWSWFAHRPKEDLPVLCRNRVITDEEYQTIRRESFHFVKGPTQTRSVPIQKVQRRKRRRRIIRRLQPSFQEIPVVTLSRSIPSSNQSIQVSFSVQDVLMSLQHQTQKALPKEDSKTKEIQEEVMEDEKTDHSINNSNSSSLSLEGEGTSEQEVIFQKIVTPMKQSQDASEIVSTPAPNDASMETQLRMAVNQLSKSLLLDNDTGMKEKEEKVDGITLFPSLKEETLNDKQENRPKKLASIPFTFQQRPLDIFSADWDELVQQAAEGLIPNGKLQSPIAITNKDQNLFSKTVHLLSPTTSMDNTSNNDNSDPPALSVLTADDTLSQVSSRVLPELEDELSIPSIAISVYSQKFQLAEEQSVYEGPEACRRMPVVKNLDLYFRTFVFGDYSSNTNATIHPRIQLWREDCRSIQQWSSSTPTPDTTNTAMTTTEERFVRVWEEVLIPCGEPALRRLAPNRRSRLSFHGDPLFTSSGAMEAYAESRHVFLCLSSQVLYIISKKDPVTIVKEQKNNNKKNPSKFPLPIPDKAMFQDAKWPHAVARHSYQDLKSICIGFDFQRLTLKFANFAGPGDSYFVYVLITSNKKKTVKLLQELQRLAKEANETVTDLVSDATAVAIENDSQNVFDALSVAVAPDMVGTVLHYQIVQQRWKHGTKRGTVRRVCVVTDSKIFMLDEDYADDGRKTITDASENNSRAGQVEFRIVDEASLQQVEQVQAAGADPRSMTIIINPLSVLSRTHRWRLVCRDSHGAERLVEDVRKAIEQHA